MGTTTPDKTGPVEMKTGLSLSRCIPQIASGIVAEENVARIITATKYNSEEKWKLAEDKLANGDWAAHPEAVNILRRLRAAGKIVQPLLDKGQKPVLPTDGRIWISEDEEEDLQWTTAIPVSEKASPSPAVTTDPIEVMDDPAPTTAKARATTPSATRTTPPVRDMPPATPKVTGWRSFFAIPNWIRLRSKGSKHK